MNAKDLNLKDRNVKAFKVKPCYRKNTHITMMRKRWTSYNS